MMAARTSGSGTRILIALPGRKLSVSVRKRSRFVAVQTILESRSAFEYGKAGNVPTGRPNTPANRGVRISYSNA
jgi:hypothetical protein